MSNITCIDDAENPGVCPRGCICNGEGNRTKCTDVQGRWIILLDGAYCPSNTMLIDNCPVGSYCPDAETKIPCTKGYFCPHKTQVPEIRCSRCKEGATELAHDLYGYIIFIVFWVAIVSFVLFKYIGQLKMNTQKHKEELQERLCNEQRESILKKEERQRINRLSPMLKSIFQRVGLDWIDNNHENVDNVEELFDAIDTTRNNIADYKELNVALHLEHTQLKEFIKLMNQRAGQPSNTPHVDKSVFVNHFFDTIEQVSNYDPTTADCKRIFEQVAGNSLSDTIELNGLYDSDLMFFLSYSQINEIIKGLKTVSEMDVEEGESQSQYTYPNTYDSVSIRFGRQITALITKDTFIGQYPFVLHHVSSGGYSKGLPHGVDISFSNLSLDVTVGGQTTPILENITGRLERKTMTALMGGSGAGKTSLLNALCGRAFYGRVSGVIMINGYETTIDEHMDIVGFVPQDDTVYAELTVRENLIFAGRFGLPRGTSLQNIEDLADDVMADLGLTRIADNIVGDVHRRGVSGGEKKRVSIGLELMADPSILFLDEPTSGLDANSAMLVVNGMKNLVEKKGVTICSVIHQPRKVIFELFDSMILLGVGGKMVYHGRVDEAEEYFGKLGFQLPLGESVADWFIDISTGRLDAERNDLRSAYHTKNSVLSMRADPVLEIKSADEKDEANKANLNRLKLYRNWIKHFEGLDQEERKKYEAPKPFEFPVRTKRQHFFKQVLYHLKRNFIVQKRNISSKVLDTIIISFAVILICFMDGKLVLTLDRKPNLRNEYEMLTSEDPIFLRENVEEIIHGLYDHSIQSESIRLFSQKVSLIVTVLLAISAAKVLVEKRLELFREAGSGYNLTAYYLAVNISSAIEHTIQIILIACPALWLRCTVASEFCLILSFIMMAWVSTSWSLFFPLFVPPKNVVIVIGFFTVFFGLLFSGTLSPTTFSDIYGKKISAFISGMFSASRHFIETMLVSELRTLPPQSGFSLRVDKLASLDGIIADFGDDTPNYRLLNAFNLANLAQHDMPKASYQSNSGWYKQILPPFLVGLTVRFGGALLVCATMYSVISALILPWSQYKELMVRLTSLLLYFPSCVVRFIPATDHSKQRLQ